MLFRSGVRWAYSYKKNGLLRCPSLPSTIEEVHYSAYGMNRYGIGGETFNSSCPGLRRLSQVSKPSRTLIFIDTWYGLSNPNEGFYDAWSVSRPHVRHTGRTANLAFPDGHVNGLPQADIFMSQSDALIKYPWSSW